MSIVKELKSLLIGNLGDEVAEVVLFGSQLKGSAQPDSDVDVLIVLKSDSGWKNRRKINDLCYEIDLKYDVFLDTQIITVNELQSGLRGKHPVFVNALKEGYHV
ncbi:MAG: nucleotidyltransferase domain-containing protein [Bacteroidetes bacterium]|nr:nucleotidyltransferase domain-containing protein [Bacteroidota bacterium]